VRSGHSCPLLLTFALAFDFAPAFDFELDSDQGRSWQVLHLAVGCFRTGSGTSQGGTFVVVLPIVSMSL